MDLMKDSLGRALWVRGLTQTPQIIQHPVSLSKISSSPLPDLPRGRCGQLSVDSYLVHLSVPLCRPQAVSLGCPTALKLDHLCGFMCYRWSLSPVSCPNTGQTKKIPPRCAGCPSSRLLISQWQSFRFRKTHNPPKVTLFYIVTPAVLGFWMSICQQRWM